MYKAEQLKALLQGHTILVAGYGREGQSTERLIANLLPDAPLTIATEVKATQWKDRDDNWHAEWPFSLIIKSPGIPMFELPSRELGKVSSLTDIFMQVYGNQVVGVTGTKGKSTTASLLHHLLEGSLLAGNIGVPLFDIVASMDERSLVVAELSCHQLEVLHRAPHVGVLLNLYQEHLDHYAGYEEYKNAKMQLALHQRAGDHLYYCTDNAELAKLVERFDMPTQLHPYSLLQATEAEQQALRQLPLAGDHNRSNALVAMRVAQLLRGESTEQLAARMNSFRGLHHRLEEVSHKCGLTWYDDSISTIPAATIEALKALQPVDTLILGGFDRGIDYSPLADHLRAHPVANIAFVGQAGRRMLQLFGPNVPNHIVEDDYSLLVQWCANHTPTGGKVLLSPAAASYDMFRNFEHRGDYYLEMINNL